jgi:hypothetical protein
VIAVILAPIVIAPIIVVPIAIVLVVVVPIVIFAERRRDEYTADRRGEHERYHDLAGR